MEIPIQNIYYLLCYAYNKLDEGKLVDVKGEDHTELVDLFGRVLASGSAYLIRRGLDRGYIEHSKARRRLTGKINFTSTINKSLLQQCQVHCDYDELNHNILHNQILKSTIGVLCKVKELNDSLRQELARLYKTMDDIDVIPLSKQIFGRVQLHSNNSFYQFLIKICELVFDNVLVSEESGRNKFRDFLKDERQMAYLFEEFVRNFYKIEQKEFYVTRELFEWDAKELTDGAAAFLPRMQTDISMESKNRKIIIDTKYYRDAMREHYGSEKFKEHNLYQIFAYVKQIETKGGLNQNCDGILLYPTVQKELDQQFETQGHRISIKTINLNQDWRDVHRDMMGVVGCG